MTIRRRFLLTPSFARLIQRERGGLRQVEGFFPEQRDRTSWVRLEESRGLLILRSAGPDGDVEEETEVPVGHVHALLDVCAGEVDYTRTKLSIGNHVAVIDHLIRPHALHLVTVEFDNSEEARGFDPLPWFGPELTADSRFNYQALALRGLSEAPDVLLSDAALDSLLDTLENCFVARSRVAMNRPTGKLVPEIKTRVAASAQANAQGTKVDLTAIEAAMMREMERTLQKKQT
jgi:CYTH domain-containing protein